MDSRTRLSRRLRAIERLLANPSCISREPSDTDHNESAQVLRNGLVISLFASLEDFARTRSTEILQSIAETTPFEKLPEKLQEALIIGTLDAIGYRSRLEEKGSLRRQFVQTHSKAIASTLSNDYTISSIAFLQGAPNVKEEDFATLIKGFGVDSPWIQIDSLSARLGINLLSSKDAFKNLINRRNNAAHQAGSLIEHADVTESLDTVTAVAVCADMLMSNCARHIRTGKAPGINGASKHTANDIKLHFLRKITANKNLWREHKESASRAIKIHGNLESGITQAQQRANNDNAHLVALDGPKRLICWSSP